MTLVFKTVAVMLVALLFLPTAVTQAVAAPATVSSQTTPGPEPTNIAPAENQESEDDNNFLPLSPLLAIGALILVGVGIGVARNKAKPDK